MEKEKKTVAALEQEKKSVLDDKALALEEAFEREKALKEQMEAVEEQEVVVDLLVGGFLVHPQNIIKNSI